MSLMVVFLLVLAAAQSPTGTVTGEDLQVIDAALGHRARRAASQRSMPLVLLDRSLPACKADDHAIYCVPVDVKSLAFIRKPMPEVTEAWMHALSARNAESHALTSAPAPDVEVVARETLPALARHASSVYAFTSLPAYVDTDTALIYLGFFCGGLCGEGNFILLKRSAGGWKVDKAVMRWIS